LETLENYFTVEETAEKLKVDPETVRRWLQDDKLKGIKMGKAWRIRESALIEFMKR
jgi:excisionase family DNA binding protein